LTREALIARVREVIAEPVALPGKGHTAERHQHLFEVGCEDLSLARLVEAHWDAVAILAEAEPGSLYGVWAAEASDKVLRTDGLCMTGKKPSCSGSGIVDRALVTVKEPEARLVDVDLRLSNDRISFDDSAWKTSAFAETRTDLATFESVEVKDTEIIDDAGFYLQRPGFWHGACGPAACWAGGAAGLLHWALEQKRDDPHTLVHLGGMKATIWSMQAILRTAGDEIDAAWNDMDAAQIRALSVRRTIEQGCTDLMRRLTRAYGPHPLAMDETIGRRYQELDLYVRQSHAERDLEVLGVIARLKQEKQCRPSGREEMACRGAYQLTARTQPDGLSNNSKGLKRLRG
jgi:alkylation response protein AidB-like acyl-CoA dehydrogenase